MVCVVSFCGRDSQNWFIGGVEILHTRGGGGHLCTETD